MRKNSPLHPCTPAPLHLFPHTPHTPHTSPPHTDGSPTPYTLHPTP
ncbi:hypothetical protein H6G72_21860 [Planktothricoides sp. FACHB-1370]|uniref:Uncharacterized protein n=1 Tax=Planktothricoides raciborskii FACHB-1370 TaxID=2949576 RepID=A0ABR8EIJ3_9CYAN|nr:hypothetical protein [Planktothricoides raciborskii FACHB-1370]MBD2584892.1 hypothetical protein [Planktothricoides raciborskii FACHB-1261]